MRQPTGLAVSVAGTTLWVERDDETKTAYICCPNGCMDRMSDDEILETVNAASMIRERLGRVLPGWKLEG